MIRIQRILAPCDFSPASDHALRYAVELASVVNASLHLVHVIEESLVYGGSMPLAMPVYAEVENEARAMLEERLSPEDRVRLQAELTILKGSPFVEIVRYAKQNEIDMIVLGTHGRGPIAHMLLGSVAERVMRKASCPVLMVREGEQEFVMP